MLHSQRYPESRKEAGKSSQKFRFHDKTNNKKQQLTCRRTEDNSEKETRQNANAEDNLHSNIRITYWRREIEMLLCKMLHENEILEV